jgi:hypothetical protein
MCLSSHLGGLVVVTAAGALRERARRHVRMAALSNYTTRRLSIFTSWDSSRRYQQCLPPIATEPKDERGSAPIPTMIVWLTVTG